MQKVYMIKIILTFSLILCGFRDVFSQQNTDASGGDATGIGGSFSFSIGQLDYYTSTGSLGTVSEGLQQPYEILITNGIEETDIQLSVFPNPTNDFVVLSVKNSNTDNMTYLLYDVQGKIIETQKLSGSETSIYMISLANDIYIIKVLKNNKEVKTFKIIKY